MFVWRWLELLSAGEKTIIVFPCNCFPPRIGLGQCISQNLCIVLHKICRFLGGFVYHTEHDPNSESCRFPETGFVYSSIEASDVLVCWYHVSLEAGVPSVMTLSIRINSRLQGSDSWREKTTALFTSLLNSNTRARCPKRVLHAMRLFQSDSMCDDSVYFSQIPSLCCWLEEVDLPNRFSFLGLVTQQGCCVLLAVECTETLCWLFFFLTSQSIIVNWRHLVFKGKTWCGALCRNVNKVMCEVSKVFRINSGIV